MAALRSVSTIISSSTKREITRATIQLPKFPLNKISLLPKLPTKASHLAIEELDLTRSNRRIEKHTGPSPRNNNGGNLTDPMVMQKLYVIMEAVADRIEMHNNIGEQRNNWNSLLLTSINTIILAAATMSAIAASSTVVGSPLLSLKLSSSLMYVATTGMLVVMNKIQPSQLAEEQRNATRLFKQLLSQMQTLIAIGNPKPSDVNEAMEKVLALDKAYPLPIIGVMLEKFPSSVEPAVWWPQLQQKGNGISVKTENNGWNENLEKEIREISGVIKRKDKDDYLRLGEKALKLNKVLAISGPLLTGLAAVGAAFVGSTDHGCLAGVVGVVGGALASVVNAVEHGGQVGMVFEMYRSNAGFFKQVEESIEWNLEQKKVVRRENGEIFEMELALQLGRSFSQLRDLAAVSAQRKGNAGDEEFASKLF